jgi:hypothetical protein
MTLKDLYQYCIDKAKEYPNLSDDIHSLYVLAEMEIEDGGSTVHECELAVSDIKELIKKPLIPEK